jgi:hypothetical protein
VGRGQGGRVWLGGPQKKERVFEFAIELGNLPRLWKLT